MLWQKYRHIIISFGLATVFSFFLVYLGSINFFTGNFVSATSTAQGKIVDETTIVLVQEKYSFCGHLEAADFSNDLKLEGLSMAEIEKKFSGAKGWTLEWQEPNTLIITRNIEGYCAEDAPRRHLAELNGYIAIYRGPAANNKLIDRVTEIKIENLPEEWIAKLKSGQLEYGTENEMLEALDSLDEFTK